MLKLLGYGVCLFFLELMTAYDLKAGNGVGVVVNTVLAIVVILIINWEYIKNET